MLHQTDTQPDSSQRVVIINDNIGLKPLSVSGNMAPHAKPTLTLQQCNAAGIGQIVHARSGMAIPAV